MLKPDSSRFLSNRIDSRCDKVGILKRVGSASMCAISNIGNEHKYLGTILYSIDKPIEEIDNGKLPDADDDWK